MRAMSIAIFLVLSLASGPTLIVQTAAQTAKATPKAKTPEELNLQEYIALLRKDVNADKVKILGEVMQFDAEDAAKFWPTYHDYDSELNKLNDMRVANIKEYAQNYTNMTENKADELIKNAMSYQKQRDELLAKCYERVKQQLGAVTAARFVQVEHQLLLIIDLKIASALPIVGS